MESNLTQMIKLTQPVKQLMETTHQTTGRNEKHPCRGIFAKDV